MPARLTVVSNGHGEDAIGAALARELRTRRPDLEIRAFPLVGEGTAYRSAGIPTLGPCRALPSGGLTLHSRENLAADLRAGWLSLTATQFVELARHRTEISLIVGDLFAQLLGAAVASRARFVYQPLVSILQTAGSRPPLHRRAMERFTHIERALLRRRAHRVYVRDQPSASWLRRHGVPHAVSLGNPAVDAVAGGFVPADEGLRSCIALLPGSRAHADRSLETMLAVVASLGRDAAVAWAMPHTPNPTGWTWKTDGVSSSRPGLLTRDAVTVTVYSHDVRSALRGARLALGTTGTATEQAAAAGVPVVSFAVPPEHTSDFLAAQKRLLGAALTVVPADVAAIGRAVEALLDDDEAHAHAALAGRARMGAAGGTDAIVTDIVDTAVALGAIHG